MLELALPALVFGSIAWMWHSMLGAKENARLHARRVCNQAQLQLLDETVALQRMRPQRGADGWLQWQRDYAFDVSSNGADRHAASLRMNDNVLLSYRLPNLQPPALESRVTITHSPPT